MISKFIHLHLHTKYSMLDGMCRLEDLAESVKKARMFAAAITDHGNMYGAVEFYNTMRRAGIKPIIGLEAYIVDDVDKNTRKKSHIVLLAKDEQGYKNLVDLSSFGFVKGFYYKPTIDKKILKEKSGGLIALSSCIQGEISSKIIENDYEGAKEAAEFYSRIFGDGNFYLELQNHGLADEETANRGLRRISKELSLPMTATNDTHYINKDDAGAHEVLLCVQTGKTLKNTERMSFESDQFYFKNYEEMKKTLPEDIAAIESTFDIAEKCNLELPKPPAKRPYYMPSYEIKDSADTYEEYFEKLARSEFEKKYTNIPDELQKRFEHEIKIIKEQGYAGYFLIVRDIVNFARENDIPVGPGRGSAAGSLIAYILKITSIDPIKYNLLFERFLNPERISPPDIDIDFSDEDRGRVIEFIVEKFGKDKVAQIITFQTLKPRQAIRDTGRVLDVPLPEVDALAKHVPEGPGMDFEAILKEDDFVAYVNSDKTGKREEIINYALKIEGLLRQDSTHAAGVVIAPEKLTNYVPIAVPKDKDKSELNYMTQYPMESLEKIGLLKFDILGLRNLSIIKRTIEMVKNTTGRDVVLENTDFDNPEVYKLLAEGNTNGVFQLESTGMQDILKKIEPACFEDIIAVISLFRPGPMRMIDDYIKRKKGIDKTKYDMPVLEKVLKDTYGIAVYQEQVMQIAVEVAGFSLAKADLLRRIMGKKKVSEMEAMRREFMDGALSRGVKAPDAEKLFEKLEQFSQYGFNKSHAAAYAVLAYQTAYLKAIYTAEYMASLMTSVMDRTEKIALYADDCINNNGIKVLPPDVNKSFPAFSVERSMIRYGLAAIKNVGVSAAEEIVKARKEQGAFQDIFDFCEKVSLRIVTGRTIESLIKAGGFDGVLANRAGTFEALPAALKKAESFQKDKEVGQFSLFEKDEGARELPETAEWSESEMLGYEKEVLGYYISSHTLARYEKLLQSVAREISDILKSSSRETGEIIIGGVIQNLKKEITKTGIKFKFDLEDLTGKIRVIANEKVAAEKHSMFSENLMLMVRGRLSYYEDFPYISLDSVITLDEAYTVLGKYLHITFREIGFEESVLHQLDNIFREHPGDRDVVFHILTRENTEITAEIGTDRKIAVSEELLRKVETITGRGNMHLSWKK